MKEFRKRPALLTLLALGAAVTAVAQDGQAVEMVEAVEAVEMVEMAESGPLIDPRADEVLRAMSKHLADMKGFRFIAENIVEAIEDGQSIHYSRRLELDMLRPGSIHAVATGDEMNKQYWYDGRTVTILDRDQNVYSTVEAPATIDAMFDHIHARYGLTMATADLLFPDPYSTLTGGVTGGRYVGQHRVGRTICHHLAFTQQSVDWQIWIDADGPPWPRKLVITYKDRPGRPHFSSRFVEWGALDERPSDYFSFTPPEDAFRIEMIPIDESASEAAQED